MTPTAPNGDAAHPPTRRRVAWSRELAIPAAVFVVALAVRWTFLWRLAHTPFWGLLGADSEEYWLWSGAIARGVPATHPFFLGPAYPYVLSWFHRLHATQGAVLIVQAVWGAAAVAMVADTVRRCTASPVAALVVGLAMAGYGMAVYFDGQILMESLLLLLEALLLWVTVGHPVEPTMSRAAAAGILVGLIGAGRPTALLLVVPLVLWSWVGSDSRVARARRAIAVLGATGLVLVPIAWHNYRMSGEFIPVTYSGGFNLYIGFNPEATGSYVVPFADDFDIAPDPAPDGTASDGRTYLAKRTGRMPLPGESSTVWQRQALQWIRTHPADAGRLAGRKAMMMWNRREYFQLDNPLAVAEATGNLGWPGVGTFAFLGALGVAGLFLVRGSSAIVLLGYAATITLSGVLFFVIDRYRIHLIPMLAVSTGVYIAAAISRMRTVFAARWRGFSPKSVVGSPAPGDFTSSAPSVAVPAAAAGRPRVAVLIAAGMVGIALVHLPAPDYGDEHARWDAIVTVADAHLSQGDAASALPYYARALEIVESGKLRGTQTTTGRLAVVALYQDAAVAHMIAGSVETAIGLLERARTIAPDAMPITLRMAEALALDHRCDALRALARHEPGRVVDHLFAEHDFWQRARPAAAPAMVEGMLCLDPTNVDGWALTITRVASTGASADATLRGAVAAGVPPERIALLLAYARALEGRRAEAEQALIAGQPAMNDPAVARLMRATYAALRQGAPAGK